MSQLDHTKLVTVAEKIKKLLALGKSPNEHEAAAAIAKAQELCATHNLNMAQVEASGGAGQKPVTEGDGQKRTKTAMKSKAMYKWQQKLAAYVASANFCMHFIQEAGEWRGERYVKTPIHVFIGREVSVVTTQLMYEYLCQAIERLVPLANNSERLSRTAMSWKEGCADRLCDRLMAQKDEVMRQQEAAVKLATEAGGTGMVLASSYASTEGDLNRDFLWDLEPGTTARHRRESEERYQAARLAQANAIQPVATSPAPALSPKELAAQERQRAKDAERAQRDYERWQERERRRKERENASKDWTAYHAGAEAGRDIGLDAQLVKK